MNKGADLASMIFWRSVMEKLSLRAFFFFASETKSTATCFISFPALLMRCPLHLYTSVMKSSPLSGILYEEMRRITTSCTRQQNVPSCSSSLTISFDSFVAKLSVRAT